MSYTPPFTLNNRILTLVADISEAVGRISTAVEQQKLLHLRKINRMRTVQGSLAIEGNTLTQGQISAILDGKRVIAPPKEVQEAHNAIAAYGALSQWQPASNDDLLNAHLLLMQGLASEVGCYRSQGVGVMSGDHVVHMAPQAERVPPLMQDLLGWLSTTDAHPLIASCVFHYEFEFIHPFADGNGRMGRLWQTLILSNWQEVFVHIPVESMVYQHQTDYYLAIRQSTAQSDAAPFIEFMLHMIFETITESIAADKTNASVNAPVNAPVNLGKMKTPEAILALIQKDPQITRQQMANHLNKNIRTIGRAIAKLQQAGKLTRIGADKTGHWEIITNA